MNTTSTMNEAALEYAIGVLEERLEELRGGARILGHKRLNIPFAATAPASEPKKKRGRQKGKKLSAEAIAKIREGQRRRWAALQEQRHQEEPALLAPETVAPAAEAPVAEEPVVTETPKRGKKRGAGD